MEEKEYSNVYAIPANYTDSGKLFGGMVETRNAIEALDVHLSRENRSKTIDKVAQRIRLNRTKLKGMQDTSTDYEELANSIQAGYYIKNGIANHNEDLFYMSVFVTVSAKTYDIVVLHEGEDHLVRLLQPKPDMKYILVVPNMAFAASLLLPDVPCLFAVVEPSVFPASPKITFYSV